MSIHIDRSCTARLTLRFRVVTIVSSNPSSPSESSSLSDAATAVEVLVSVIVSESASSISRVASAFRELLVFNISDPPFLPILAGEADVFRISSRSRRKRSMVSFSTKLTDFCSSRLYCACWATVNSTRSASIVASAMSRSFFHYSADNVR